MSISYLSFYVRLDLLLVRAATRRKPLPNFNWARPCPSSSSSPGAADVDLPESDAEEEAGAFVKGGNRKRAEMEKTTNSNGKA